MTTRRTENTPPKMAPPPPPRNYLAEELRQIAADLHTIAFPDVVKERLLRLTESVETLAAAPTEHTLEALPAGLDPEQQIRARAAELAIYMAPEGERTPAQQVALVLELAGPLAAWIRDGTRPATSEEATTHA